MPAKRWIDKKDATTYALVHRPQNDPRIHDDEASSMVFAEVNAPNKKVKTKSDLEDELALDPTSVRDNEGEAALHGIFYDDTAYDYMQHMRDLGASTEGCFVEAAQPSSRQKKAKGKQKLEDALREAHLDEGSDDGGVKLGTATPLLEEEVLPQQALRKGTYQDQQDVPDALAGFQPDMDPRLREALEALEDEAYVDDDDNIFEELAQGGEEVSQGAWETTGQDFDIDMDDGWETDDTARPDQKPRPEAASNGITAGDDSAWLAEFGKFKKDQKAHKAVAPPTNSDLQSSLLSSSSLGGGRLKKRKGALTSSTGYSMTSSSLARTEGHTMLDARFDKIEEEYSLDTPDGVSLTSSTASQQGPVRGDFDSLTDDFLGSYSMVGKKRVKRGGNQSGIEQLDEIRKGLGPARVKVQKA
ncbi:MAG: hypothetical protein M1833_000034 [Piccolia ochrophora]|nr:MAG: hypothetical protein M1833_000034 [Piccolia ochrophora]